MKKVFPIILLAISLTLLTSCFNRIGKLTMVSTRNVDRDMSDYKLFEKGVIGKAKTKKDDALEIAIDNAVKKFPTGEFMKNAIVSVSGTGKKLKVEGDVWGFEVVGKNVTKSVTADIKFAVGDKVTFKSSGKLVEGTILGVNADNAVIEYINLFGKTTKAEVKYEELTKIGI